MMCHPQIGELFVRGRDRVFPGIQLRRGVCPGRSVLHLHGRIPRSSTRFAATDAPRAISRGTNPARIAPEKRFLDLSAASKKQNLAFRVVVLDGQVADAELGTRPQRPSLAGLAPRSASGCRLSFMPLARELGSTPTLPPAPGRPAGKVGPSSCLATAFPGCEKPFANGAKHAKTRENITVTSVIVSVTLSRNVTLSYQMTPRG